MHHSVDQAIADHLSTIERVKEIRNVMIETARSISQALRKGNKVLVMGNGGSAADAQHMAGEFVGRFLRERKALPAIALTTDTSILTAVGNDYGYETVFTRQVEALAEPGDVVVGISTSGNSANVLKALDRAKEIGCLTVGLSGGGGGKIAESVDLSLIVYSSITPRIQEGHILLIHILCDLVEQEFV